MRSKMLIVATCALLAGTAAAWAEDQSTQEFKALMQKSETEMAAVPFTGDADVDFMRHMRQHHKGGVEMADVQLKYGKDPKARSMAEKIKQAQQREIAEIDKWLQEHSHKDGHKE